MTPGEIIQKDDLEIQLEFTDENGQPEDITGWVIMFTLSNSTAPYAVILSKPAEITNGIGGLAKVPITTSELNIPVGKYDYEVVIKDTSNKRKSLGVSTYRILKTITETF